MLSGDAQLYYETMYSTKRGELLKRRDADRQTARQNLTNLEDAIQRCGYLQVFQPDFEYIAALGRACAEAIQKAYEMQGEPLSPGLIHEAIMTEVSRVLAETSAGVLAGEQGRMKLVEQRTGREVVGASAIFANLRRNLEQLVNDTQKEIRSKLTLQMLEAKKNDSTGKRGASMPPGAYAFHSEIEKVSGQLFREGNFRQAVLDAFIHLIAAVKERTGLPYEGDDLMNRAFSFKGGVPPVRFNALNTTEEKDEHQGIWFLFKGVVGMRNYKAHVVTPFDDPQRAHEYLALASLLMRLLDSANIEKTQSAQKG